MYVIFQTGPVRVDPGKKIQAEKVERKLSRMNRTKRKLWTKELQIRKKTTISSKQHKPVIIVMLSKNFSKEITYESGPTAGVSPACS